MARKSSGWHVENTKAEIRKRFGTLAAFARLAKLSPQIVSDVLRSPNASSRVEKIIAAHLEVSPAEIWPDRWTPDGKKIDRAEFLRQRRAERATA